MSGDTQPIDPAKPFCAVDRCYRAAERKSPYCWMHLQQSTLCRALGIPMIRRLLSCWRARGLRKSVKRRVHGSP